MTILQKFISKKTREALLYLLNLQEEPSTERRLARAVYFIEREAILRGGEPIIGCKLYFENGFPAADIMGIVSEDFFSFTVKENNGEKYIYAATHQKLYGSLSDFDIKLIREVYDQLRYYPNELPKNFFRSILPEYIDTEKGERIEVTYMSLLRKNGYSLEETADIIDDIEYGKKVQS
ncbi:MAG: hypothetical protein IJI14_07670 [Anaerolineaceae bacterium]|nr:hypothetical protein [Anaerolineaceae bacterium]